MTFTDSYSRSVKPKPGRNIIRIIFCLVLAIMLWLLNVLSEPQEDIIAVELNYKLADNKVNTIKLPDEASILVRTSGWNLLKEYFFNRSLSLDLINYTDKELLLTNNNISIFSQELPAVYQILHISPDTLNMQFDELISKNIPVFITTSATNKNAFGIDSIFIEPDSITISGAESLIGETEFWPTEPIEISPNDTLYKGSVALEYPDQNNIHMSAIVVSYKIMISPYTIHSFTTLIPIPGTKDLKTVVVNYTTENKNITTTNGEGFQFITRYDSVNHRFNIINVKYPEGAQNINTVPAFLYTTKPK